MATKTKWWSDEEFKKLIIQTRDESLPKRKREQAWNEIFTKFLIPMTTNQLRKWKKNADPWIIAGDAWNSVKSFDLSKETSSYSFCLVCIYRSLGNLVRNDEQWSESDAFVRVKHKEFDELEIPDGWFCVGTQMVKGAFISKLAPYNHRIDPECDREVLDVMEFPGTDDDDPVIRADLGLPQAPETLLTTTTPQPDGLVWGDLSDVTREHILRASGNMDWMATLAWDYLQLIITKTPEHKHKPNLPRWDDFAAGSIWFYGCALNRDDQGLVLAIIAKAIQYSFEE